MKVILKNRHTDDTMFLKTSTANKYVPTPLSVINSLYNFSENRPQTHQTTSLSIRRLQHLTEISRRYKYACKQDEISRFKREHKQID